MRISVFFLFGLLFGGFSAFGQSQRDVLDSLQKELSQTEQLEDRLVLLSELTWNYVPFSIDSAITFGEEGIKLAQRGEYPELLSQIYSDLGYAWMEKGELIQARESYQAALKIRYELGDSTKIYGILTNLGSVYQRDFQSDSAMANYLKALSFFERSGNERNADFIRNNIGVVYLEMRNYAKALEILLEVADYRKSTGDEHSLAMTYTNLGNIYKNLGRFTESEDSYMQALQIFNELEDAYYSSTTYNNLATLYNAQKKSAEAVSFAEKGLELAALAGASYDYALIESNLAKSYYDLGDYGQSRNFYLRAVANFRSQNAEEDLAGMYLLMSPVYAALGMPDSVGYYTEAYVALNKELIEQQILERTTDLEARYQTEQKDAAIAYQQQQIRNRTIQLVGSLLLAIVLAGIGYLLYSQQKIKNRQLKQEGELKSALVQIETQNKLEEQRMLISRDLHDNIGAQLTFIISAIENLKYFDPVKEQLTQRYDTIAHFTKQTITELRDTIWAMNAGEVSWEQLSARIADYLGQAQRASDQVSYEFIGGETLDPALRFDSASGIQVYRVLQEAIQNAIKYAEAKNIQVRISEETEKLNILIQDDGKGFEEDQVQVGNGLSNMRKRAEELGGELSIASKDGQGTEIKLSWPKKKKAE